MAALTQKITKEIFPCRTTLYLNLFVLRVSISINETPVTVERRGGRELLNSGRSQTSSSPGVSGLAVESCFAKLQECLQEHGGGKVGKVWFDGDVPLFLVEFHTRLALRKMLAGRSEMEEKLMTKLQRDWEVPEWIRCKVDTELFLVCPDYYKKNHNVIPVNTENQESCIEMWVGSELLEFGSLLRCCRVEVPRPDVSMRLLSNDLAYVWRWYHLGIQLGVPEAELRKIECDYHRTDDRMLHMLSAWLRIDAQASWSKLVKALVAISERHVARTIAEKYGVPFSSESEPETKKSATEATSSVVESGLDTEVMTKMKLNIDSKLAALDKELDKLKRERRQHKKTAASAREEAEVVVRKVESLEQEKQLLLKEVERKERELGCFKRVYGHLTSTLTVTQHEKEDLQESIKTKERELQESKARLEENEKKLKKYKEKIRSLKEEIKKGVRELGVRDGRITELEKDKAKVVAELESERKKNMQNEEEVKALKEELIKKLAEKEADIDSRSKCISDLQQQLKLAVEMNAQSLLLYEQLAEQQEAMLEREREKIAIESELIATRREEQVKNIMSQQVTSYTCHVSGPGLQSATVNHPTHVIVDLTDSSNRPCSVRQKVTAELECISKATPTSPSLKPPAVHAAVATTSSSRYEVSYTAISRGQHKLHVQLNDVEISGSPFTMTVYPDPTQLAQPVRVVTGLNWPYRIDFKSCGEMIVSEYWGHRIAIFDIRGQRIRTFGSWGDSPEQMRCPAGIAIDDMDNIYVSSWHKLQKVTSSGELIRCVGQWGSKVGEFNDPLGVTLYNNQVYVCDSDNHRIQLFDLDLNFIRSIGSRGKGRGEFDTPFDIKFNPDGYRYMYVAELGNARVQVLDRSGYFIRVFGQKGKGKLHTPSALHIVDKYVYVSDRGGHRIVVYVHTYSTHIHTCTFSKLRNGRYSFSSRAKELLSSNTYNEHADYVQEHNKCNISRG